MPGIADASQDAVLCCYLFHELPAAARAAAAAEFSRVLKPGGRLFFADSAQAGDGAANGMATANDRALAGFPRHSHEPFYEEYTRCDLPALFAAAGGLLLTQSRVGWLTKIMVFEKPSAQETAATVQVAAVAAVAEVPAAGAEAKVPAAVAAVVTADVVAADANHLAQ